MRWESEMKKTSYKLEIIFGSDAKPEEIDAQKVESAIVSALVVSMGGNITIPGARLKLSVYEVGLADIPLETKNDNEGKLYG